MIKLFPENVVRKCKVKTETTHGIIHPLEIQEHKRSEI